MATQREPGLEPEPVSGWALGGIAFAASVMVLLGVFQAIAGLVAIFDDEFYVVRQNYTFDLDTTAWGWIQLGYPVWSILIIALDVWVIWAITRPGAIRT